MQQQFINIGHPIPGTESYLLSNQPNSIFNLSNPYRNNNIFNNKINNLVRKKNKNNMMSNMMINMNNNMNNMNNNMNNMNNMMNNMNNMDYNKNFQVLNSTNNKLCTVNMSLVFHDDFRNCLEIKINNADNNDENEEETTDLNMNKFYGIHFDYNDLIKIFKLNTASFINIKVSQMI